MDWDRDLGIGIWGLGVGCWELGVGLIVFGRGSRDGMADGELGWDGMGN